MKDAALGRFEDAAPDGDAPGPARLCYAAAHVVMKPAYAGVSHSLEEPGTPEEIGDYIDWDATLALRTRLDGLGFGIAEAMDTAQRFALGWSNAKRLIQGCGELNLEHGFIAGAGTDHLESIASEDDLVEGVVFQAKAIQEAGGQAILLPLPWLARNDCDEETYVALYRGIIEALDGPLFIHWLGEMFMPALKGYFPGHSFERIMALDPSKVRGAKLSLLDAGLEIRCRKALLERDQIVLTGDDFNFAGLIRGESTEILRYTEIAGRQVPLGAFSHALLGVFDAIAEPASRALRFLAQGNLDRYTAIMAPCETLGQWIFQNPTQHYKAGLAFLSWLNGLQDNVMLVNHEEQTRDRRYYLRAAELAGNAGAIRSAERARTRLADFNPE